MSSTSYQGQCLCGGVGLTVKPQAQSFFVCHCNTCQTWTGGPQLSLSCGRNVEITGQEMITEYKSSPWATRAFCKQCGTHLYSKMRFNGEYNVPLGFLDIPKQHKLSLTLQYFIDLKPASYSLDSDSPVLTEAEVLDMFS